MSVSGFARIVFRICAIHIVLLAPHVFALEPADLIVLNGHVVTLDPALASAEAVAVRDTRIIAVGTNAQIAALADNQTEKVDAAGRLVIPGFIEGHGHFLGLGRALQVLDLTQAESWDDIVGQVAQAADQAVPGEWILGRGWHQDKWQVSPQPNVDGVPYNDALNQVAPENPVLLGHASGHASFANNAALAAAGIGPDTQDPLGGTIVRREDGRATGLLRENAQYFVQRLVPAVDADQMREQVALAGQVALRHGVTSFHDAGSNFATIEFFKDMEAAGELPIRLYVMVRGETIESMAKHLGKYFSALEGNDFLTVRSIKRQIGGALGAHGAWLLEPYEDLQSSAGLMLESIEEIEKTARLAVQFGYQVNTHAIGTRANRETLDLYERIWDEVEVEGSNLRWRIEHAQHIHPDDVPRFGKLGVIAAVQGVHCTSDGPWIPTRLGVSRTEATSYRWRDLIDTGAVINNGTDVPVEHIDPIASFAASVTRVMNTGEAFYPEQGMSRIEALKSFTINNAYSAFEESHKGSISVGKLADMVILSDNILTMPAERIHEAKVDLTVLGGEVVFVRERD